MEYAIPQSGPNGGTGYADIVDLILHKVYEIKTFVGAAGGVIEAQRYADMAQVHCAPPIPQNPWSVGNDYPAHTIPFGATDELVVQQYPAYPGVIVYYKRRRRGSRPSAGAVAADSAKKKKGGAPEEPATAAPAISAAHADSHNPCWCGFGESCASCRSGENAEDPTRRFLQQNPELVYLVAGVAIAIFVATIAEDILTAGAGIADDPATIGAAYALWRIAMQMQQAH